MAPSKFAVAAFVALCAGPTFAQPAAEPVATVEARPKARVVRLPELLDVVVRQNPDLMRTEAEAEAVAGDALAAAGVDDWQVRGTGSASSKRRGFVSGNPFQTTKEDTLALSGGLNRSLPTGGTFDLALTGNVADLTFSVLDTAGTRFDVDTTAISGSFIATLTQPLLGGRGSRVARAPRRRAALSRDGAELQRSVAAIDVVRDLITAYWELAYATQRRTIQEQSLALAQEQLRITRLAIERRASAPTEALAIEQAIAVREQDLLLAGVEISERSLALRRLAGLEIGPGEVDLAIGEAPTAEAASFDLDQTLATARSRNPRLAVARLGVDAAALDLAMADDAARARLDLSASAGPDASATKLDDTVDQIGKLKSFSAAASLTYRDSAGGRTGRGGQQRARATSRRAKVDVATLERDISVEVVRAIDLVRTAQKRIEVSAIAVRLAEQNLKNERLLLDAGDSRAFDVLERQDELARAQLSAARAVIDHRIAVAGVEALTGDLLPRYGVAAARPGR